MTVIASSVSGSPLTVCKPEGNMRQCRVWLTPEEDGGFSVEAISVPGVASQGETIEEAIENIKEAYDAAFETYKSTGMDLPWTQVIPEERPFNVVERWILVNV